MIASRILLLALLSGLVNALPHRVRDSSTNEPAVSAPNGTPITEGTQPAATPVDKNPSGSSGGSSMGHDGSNMGSSGGMGSKSSMDHAGGKSGMGSSASMDSMSAMDSMSTMDSMSAMDSTSTMDSMPTMDSMSTMDSMTTMGSMSTSTSSAWSSYQTPTYGSGSSNWGSSNSGYDDCVSQCMAQHGSPPQAWKPPTQTTPDNKNMGSGATHTVIVAPSQGVLRYVPFALNASVGDTVKFVWGAGPHTVTKSSELTPCNKSTTAPFASGVQMVGATFTQVVNDTNPTFFYCGVPDHCQQGMFGIINPPSAADATTAVSMMMPNWTASNPDISAYAAITRNMTQNNVAAGNWGGNIDSKSLPSWSYTSLAENVMYTRNFLASNPDVMKEDGTIDLSNAGSTPLMFPQDVSQVLSNAGAGAVSSSSTEVSTLPSNVATSAASAGTTETPSANASNINGAMTTSPKFAVALAAAAASLFLL